MLTDRRQASSESSDGHNDIVSPIPALFNSICPSDVTRNISKRVVYPFQSHTRFRFSDCFRNILQEVRKRSPCRMHRNPTATIIRPALAIRVSASLNHTSPFVKENALPHFGCMAMFEMPTTARRSSPASKPIILDDGLFSADTNAQTAALPAISRSRISNHFPLAEGETYERDLIRHRIGSFNVLFSGERVGHNRAFAMILSDSPTIAIRN